VGEGPGGGLLVNPGAVFGTSRTDLENGLAGRTHQGVAIVTVEGGRPSVDFMDTAPRDRLRLVDVDVTGKSAESARAEVERCLSEEASPGTLLFPRVHGTLSDGTLANLSLGELTRQSTLGSGNVHWDVRELSSGSPELANVTSETEVESAEILRLLAETGTGRAWLLGAEGERRVRELLRELGQPKSDGESRQDYENARIGSARRILGVRRDREGD